MTLIGNLYDDDKKYGNGSRWDGSPVEMWTMTLAVIIINDVIIGWRKNNNEKWLNRRERRGEWEMNEWDDDEGWHTDGVIRMRAKALISLYALFMFEWRREGDVWIDGDGDWYQRCFEAAESETKEESVECVCVCLLLLKTQSCVQLARARAERRRNLSTRHLDRCYFAGAAKLTLSSAACLQLRRRHHRPTIASSSSHR